MGSCLHVLWGTHPGRADIRHMWLEGMGLVVRYFPVKQGVLC